MSLIGFRRDEGELEYLEEVEYAEGHLEDDLHELIRDEPRLAMGTLTTRENVVLASKAQLPTGKELDMLACDKRGTLTLIEFKRDRSPRNAVSQLFDYASSLNRLNKDEFLNLIQFDSIEAVFEEFDYPEDSEFDINDFENSVEQGLESPQLMLVAYSISDDVRRITRWLRDIHELKINCVEFDYYKRDNAEMFVPSIIGEDETQEIKDKEARPRDKKYRQFYIEILERFKQELPGVTNRSATTDSWLTIPTGQGDKAELVWHFRGDPGEKSLTVNMTFHLDNTNQNMELLENALDILENKPIEIEEEVHYGEYGTSGYTRLYFERDVGQLDHALDDEDLKSWAVDTMVKLHRHLTPFLDEELG